MGKQMDRHGLFVIFLSFLLCSCNSVAIDNNQNTIIDDDAIKDGEVVDDNADTKPQTPQSEEDLKLDINITLPRKTESVSSLLAGVYYYVNINSTHLISFGDIDIAYNQTSDIVFTPWADTDDDYTSMSFRYLLKVDAIYSDLTISATYHNASIEKTYDVYENTLDSELIKFDDKSRGTGDSQFTYLVKSYDEFKNVCYDQRITNTGIEESLFSSRYLYIARFALSRYVVDMNYISSFLFEDCLYVQFLHESIDNSTWDISKRYTYFISLPKEEYKISAVSLANRYYHRSF